MARENKKISALTALTGANVDGAADYIPIVDTSVSTTKKITPDELALALNTTVERYVATFVQSGATAPTMTVISNGFSGALVASRISGGNYALTLAGAFTGDVIFENFGTSGIPQAAITAPLTPLYRGDPESVTLDGYVTFKKNDSNTIYIYTYNTLFALADLYPTADSSIQFILSFYHIA